MVLGPVMERMEVSSKCANLKIVVVNPDHMKLKVLMSWNVFNMSVTNPSLKIVVVEFTSHVAGVETC